MTVATKLQINGDRLVQSLDRLGEIGQLSTGGIRRISYTMEDIQARNLVQQWMIDAGMAVRIDAAGNIIGTYPGQRTGAALATGSHIDTVPAGGRYDGCLGVLAGIEVVRTLKENGIVLNHPLEVIVFTDEEGSMIGSKAMAGIASSDPASFQRADGTAIQTCLERVGGNWEKLATARRTRADIATFVELHVEQGGILDATGKEIGVVEGIVSMNRAAITVLGRPNHAGTTPMHLRRDALVAAAHIVLAVEKLGTQPPGQQVATVGILNVSPNAANIVPGRVDMSLDIRDLSQSVVADLMQQLQQTLEAIATQTQTDITMVPTLCSAPVLALPYVQEAIVEVCQELGFSYCHLPSRAGHDAQEIGQFTDTGMIFVPSIGGISHAETEYTAPEQCTQGANVLLHTLLKLDTSV